MSPLGSGSKMERFAKTEMAMSPAPGIAAARAALAASDSLLTQVRDSLAARASDRGRIANDRIDRLQLPVYEFALAATSLRVAAAMLEYATAGGELEMRLALLCTAEAAHDLRSRLGRAPEDFGIDTEALRRTFEAPGVREFLDSELRAARYEELAAAMETASGFGALGLNEDQEMIRDTFRRFAEDVVAPHAEKVHRDDRLVP